MVAERKSVSTINRQFAVTTDQSCLNRWLKGQTHHVYFVGTAYSLLMYAMHQSGPHEWTRRTLTTSGATCRAVKGEFLERLVEWLVDKLSDDDWSLSQVKAVLAQA